MILKKKQYLHSPSSLVTCPLYSGTYGRKTSFIKYCNFKIAKIFDYYSLAQSNWVKNCVHFRKFQIYLHESRALLWGTIFWERFLDRDPLWNFLDVRQVEPMDTVVFCMFERMVSIVQCFVIFSIPMAIIKYEKKNIWKKKTKKLAKKNSVKILQKW